MINRLTKIGIGAIFLAVCTNNAMAQDERDALRYSQLQTQGTARSIGFGNALGSVGGDFSSLSVNPAGIGIYRKSEFMITPSLTLNNVNSTYLGNDQSNSGGHFAISNFGFVFSNPARGKRYERSKWKVVSVGIGLNRTADFTHNYTYQGQNNSSSASFVFESDANNPQYPYNPQDANSVYRPADLGYQSYLLDTGGKTSSGQTLYHSLVDPAKYPISQRNTVRERGGISELLLSVGGNYKEKLMVGGTIGVPVVRYTWDRILEESNTTGGGDFNNFNYNQHLSTNGMGVNLKLGLIYKLNEKLRVGLAVHTSTVYWLTDQSDANITADTKPYGIHTASTPQQQYSYSMTTPWRAIASATAMLGSFGFFTVDYEYVDFRTSKYHFPTQDAGYEQLINDVIKNTYSGASNIRTGLEIKLSKMFMVRGGFGYVGNPYKSTIYNDGQRLDYSCGIGLRLHDYFADLGFVHHQYKDTEQPYNANYTNVINPTAILNTGKNNAVFTLGWKF